MSKENEQQSKLEIKRHSLAHVLAAAVLEVFPETKFGYGPPVENGFYYDFELPRTLVPEDLPIIEEKMKNIIKQNFPLEHKTISIEEAKSHYDKLNQKYKLELLEDLEKEGYKEVSVYKLGQFVDLCNGPHLESAGEINADSFKLTRISGAYWKGDENQPMLQRVYGVAFNNKKELKKYLKELEEAEKRNHRKIGKEMDLFANFEEIGQGLPVWLPNGYAMRKTLEDYMLKMERLYGYEHIATPHINKAELFEKSGHLGFYQDSMYSPIEIDGQTFYLKPMNCPAAMMVYKRKPYSYRDLPYKLGEFGTVYRYEKSGELHGLQRVRGFTQNDAHVFCTSDQLKSQIKEILEMMVKFYINLGFENYKFRLSLSDPENDKYIGSKEDWQEAEDTIRQVLQEEKMEFTEKKERRFSMVQRLMCRQLMFLEKKTLFPLFRLISIYRKDLTSITSTKTATKKGLLLFIGP